MNKSMLTGIGAVLLVTSLAGAGAVKAADLAVASWRYPRSRQVISEHVDLGTLTKGYASEADVYTTDDELPTVAAWYVERYHLMLDHGLRAQGQCTSLATDNGLYVLRQTMVVMLCPVGHGTQVYVDQLVYLGL